MAKEHLQVLRKHVNNFMPILFNIYDKVGGHTDVGDAISLLCSISKSETVDEYFKQVLKKLLQASTELNSGKDLSDEEIKERVKRYNF